MRALSKPLAELTWADVETFCERRVTEGTSLDYKQDFPAKLEKTIAAMANTLGGTIVIGVADDDGKPVLPVAGIKLVNGLAEKVLEIAVANIAPPVVPEVQVCSDPKGERAIVVIQVPMSQDAPHAIESNTQVYIRTGQRNDPDALANLDRLEWMLGNRKKAEEFRDWLVLRANQRFVTISNGEVPQIARSQGFVPNKMFVPELPCVLTVFLVPTYPDPIPLMLPTPLQKVIREIAVRDPMNTTTMRHFPFLDVRSRLVEDGAVIHLGELERTYHTHLNVHGLYLHKQSLLYPLVNKSDGSITPVIRSTEIIRRTRTMIDSAAKLYTHLNYSGPLHVRIQLERIIGYPLHVYESSGEQHIRYSADLAIDALDLSSTDELSSRADALGHRLVRRIGWAFDWDFSEADIRNAMKD